MGGVHRVNPVANESGGGSGGTADHRVNVVANVLGILSQCQGGAGGVIARGRAYLRLGRTYGAGFGGLFCSARASGRIGCLLPAKLRTGRAADRGGAGEAGRVIVKTARAFPGWFVKSFI
jgi:hypothetical protein